MNKQAVVLPRLARSFSTGSLQHLKQTEDFTAAKKFWDRWAKGLLICLGVGGCSFSAMNTSYLYNSRDSKAYWNNYDDSREESDRRFWNNDNK